MYLLVFYPIQSIPLHTHLFYCPLQLDNKQSSSLEFFLCIATSYHQTAKVTPSQKGKASRLFISQMRPPNPQLSVPPGAVCRGAIVDQAIQGLFDQPVDALAVASQRPVG